MNYQPFSLEDFDLPAPAAAAPMEAVDTEAIRLDAYEAGYKSGWDDAVSEREQSGAQIAANLERTLSELTFTYEEARQEVLSGLSSLFTQIIERFLPAMASASVLPQVEGELQALLAELGTGNCTLVASPETCQALEWLSEAHLETDIQIKPEAAFGDGRVQLQIATETRDIDLSGMIDAMGDAIRDFMQSTGSEEEKKHG